MAIDGHGLTIKVDPSGFDKFVAETVNKSIQESLDNMALGMIDMSKKLSFDGKAHGTADFGSLAPPPEATVASYEPAPSFSMDRIRQAVIETLERPPRASLVEVDNG